ncbi:MAG: SH3 domain-containing protein [Roseiflexaceae bacterium]|nr:SH3 domain-containing protein [Roseiflexaceae bacterium]
MQRPDTRETATTTTTTVMARPYAGGWIGYDWFKLVVAAILAALLLWFWLNPPLAAVPSIPVVAVATVPVAATAAPAVAPVAPAAPAATAPAIAGVPALPVLELPTEAILAGATTFNGTAEPGATVQLLVDGEQVGETVAAADGTWSIDADVPQPGDYAVTARTVGADGATLNESAATSITVEAPQVAAEPPTVSLPTGDLTAGQPTISGTGTPNQSIELLVDGAVVGTASVGADGTWSLPVELAVGSYQITARPAGESAATSAPASVTVAATSAPAAPAPAAGAAPAITAPSDNSQIPAGPITVSGTGTAGTQIEVLDGDRVVGTATVAADGTWSLEDTPTEATAVYSARPAGSTEAAAATTVRVTTGPVATCAELAVGCDAWVTREGGLQLRIRAGPGTSAEIITRLPIGTQMAVLEGPQPANDFTWWRVRTNGGQEGWIAGEQVRLQPD